MIRHFIYLDEEKMFSLSSQLFAGVTRSYVERRDESKQAEESQEGPKDSGRLLARIATQTAGRDSQRHLHDYGYTLFEDELNARGAVLHVTEDATLEQLGAAHFVRLSGRPFVSDNRHTCKLISEYRDFQESTSYVTTNPTRVKLGEQLKVADKHEAKTLKAQLQAIETPQATAKHIYPDTDHTYLKMLAKSLERGFGDFIEMRIEKRAGGQELSFYSLLKRAVFKEDIDLLIKLYSRQTKVPLTIFGIVTQTTKTAEQEEGRDPETVKEALRDIARAISGIEESYFGLLDNEVCIEPIAVYREIPIPPRAP